MARITEIPNQNPKATSLDPYSFSLVTAFNMLFVEVILKEIAEEDTVITVPSS